MKVSVLLQRNVEMERSMVAFLERRLETARRDLAEAEEAARRLAALESRMGKETGE